MSGQTIAQKILARHASRDRVETGQFIVSPVDLIMVNDITGPPAFDAFAQTGKETVFDPAKVILIPDHFTPNKDVASAEQCKTMRTFAAEHKTVYYEVGRLGIAHVTVPEEGFLAPGMVCLGADSHTCTYGAANMLGMGVGSTDAGAAMAAGKTWLKVPETVRVQLTGELAAPASAKDVILTLIGMIGTDGARYQVLEFGGPGLATLPMEARLTIANMTTEAGAKAGVFEYDQVLADWLKETGSAAGEPAAPDADAVYSRTVEIDLSTVVPTVSAPHSPANAAPAEDYDIKIDQAIIGSCTNGRLSDLAIAAEYFKTAKPADHVRVVILPGSQRIWLQALEAGYLKIFAEAGCAVSTPTCGPCLGGHMGILANKEVCISTTNRNFRGRMGHAESLVYLASPATAAASAIAGKIVKPEAK